MSLRRLRNAVGDEGGAAAIEFALVFPIIFLLYIGSAEALQAYQAQRCVSHIASAMADITAQSRTVTQSELDDTLSASIAMIYPFPNTTVQQRLSSFTADSNGTIKNDWTAKRNYTLTDTPSVPNGYLAAGESVIVSDVVYDYKSTFGFFLPKTIRFTRHAYIRPRLTTTVEKVS